MLRFAFVAVDFLAILDILDRPLRVWDMHRLVAHAIMCCCDRKARLPEAMSHALIDSEHSYLMVNLHNACMALQQRCLQRLDHAARCSSHCIA